MHPVLLFIKKYCLGFNAVVLTIFTLLNASSVVLSTYTQQRNDAPERVWKKYNPKHMVATVEVGKLLLAMAWLGFELYADIRREQRQEAMPTAARETSFVPRALSDGNGGGGGGGGGEGREGLSTRPGHSDKGEGDGAATLVAVSSPSPSSATLPRPAARTPTFPLSVFIHRYVEEVSLFHIRVPTPRSFFSSSPPPERQDVDAAAASITAAAAVPKATESPTEEEEEEKGPMGTAPSSSNHTAGGGEPMSYKTEDIEGDSAVEVRVMPAAIEKVWRETVMAAWRVLLPHVNGEAFLMAVPAVAYALQNLFILDAQASLDPMVYQIVFQVRILLMAVSMRLVMKTHISLRRWLSLTTLLLGVILGRLGAPRQASRTRNYHTATTRQRLSPPLPKTPLREGRRVAALHEEEQHTQRTGMVAAVATQAVEYVQRHVALAALAGHGGGGDEGQGTARGIWPSAATTGSPSTDTAAASGKFLSGINSLLIGISLSVLSAVYMELVFKKRATKAHLSTRNIHLALFSLVYFVYLGIGEYRSTTSHEALVRQRQLNAKHANWLHSSDPDVGVQTVYYEDFYDFCANYFHGFDWVVLVMILIKASNGMLTAIVMRYSDNIIKTLATATAIVVSGVWGHFLFDNELSTLFMIGAAVVIGSVCLYNVWK